MPDTICISAPYCIALSEIPLPKYLLTTQDIGLLGSARPMNKDKRIIYNGTEQFFLQ